ncbi:MAG TPA: hypothetical protein VF037_10355 [Gemmatimonadales bacterium]
MNRALAAALDDALRRLGDSLPADWRRIVMVKNDGPIPVPPHPVDGDPARGFNLLLLSEAGDPAYYVRCRDAADAVAAREIEVLRILADAPALRPHLLEAAGSRSGGIQVLATRYVDGPLLARLVQGMPVPEWQATLEELIDLTSDVGRVARERLPDAGSAAPFDFAAASRDGLKRLADRGLGAARSEALARVLDAAGTAARFPQHGDLWPGNVIRDGSVWRLLDFEHFGLVDAPLFDACHLTFTGTEYLLTGGHGLDQPWVSQVHAGTPVGRASRNVLVHAARRLGLAPEAAAGALVHYLVEGTDRLMRRGAMEEVWQFPFREVTALAELIERGSDPEQVFFEELVRD